jgi:outer membrane protein assembly factor BamB
MRIAIPFCRALRGAKPTTLGKALAISVAAVLLAAGPALAEHTRWWRQSSFEDFDKGTAKGVALRSDGKLFLAPHFAEFADANLAYLLALRADSKGNLYAAGGSNAKVLRLDASGKATTVFESSELAAQALAVDAAGNLFVGTSPDGKVYKVTPAGQSSVFFEPKTKYIWDLTVDKDGTVYVATGDTGKIFSVAPDGKGQVFYSGEETHIRTLAIDSSGNILAGTEPSGLVLRISKAGDPRRAFVLFETAKKEITALLQDSSGNLYVAAVGEKTPQLPGMPRPPITDPTAAGNFNFTMGGSTNPLQQPQGNPFAPIPTVTSSSVYRIASDGSPEDLWSSRDDLVYALGLGPNGKLLLGTGNQGAVLELEGNHIFSRLVRTASGQVTSLASGPGGKLYLAAANPGKILTLGPDSEPEGSYESQPFDAHLFTRWGRLQWWGQNAAPLKSGAGARIEFYTRSGNTSDPGNNWSPWAGPYSNAAGEKIESPSARFVQWKLVLRGGAAGAAPELDWVSVAYLPKNVPPEVTGIAIQNTGIRVQGISVSGQGGASQTPVQVRMPQPPAATSSISSAFASAAAAGAASAATTPRFDAVPQGFTQKGYQSVVWTAEDPNDDQLEFSIYFRGENETTWKLLKDKLDARYYTWDTTAMPDGAYYLKIVASDAPANPNGEGLTSARESDRFEVDNTPPAIAQLTAEIAGGAGGVRVRFQASDPASSIARAQYSLDAEDWNLVFPSGGLSDAPRENYDFQLQKVAPGEHTVTIRVYDQFENVTSAKATVRVTASGN